MSRDPMGRDPMARDHRWRRRRRPTGDDGQVMILTLGFVVVALLLITVVVSAAGVHLERKRLLALADLLALEAADAVGDDRYFAPGAGQGDPDTEGLPLTDASVRAAVDRYLRDNRGAATEWEDVAVLSATTPDGRSAHVHLGAVVRPALVSWVLAPWSDGIPLEAESVARGS
ncbi:pilus assembly protein TadG-related protein [uncultured Cellulomonas sp.]|uniref:pilus assembly protein TadG-related protein n=1 Tax=uncultured Cellulomonas sp. TaxID=189682 RepID=UPI0028EA99E1|nr:pilus assembly protein TadG-related protein [uncultured Cellulomonas sp.]